MTSPKRIALLASGGPAPGINSVINAATIEAINLGWEVLGVRDGYRGLKDDDVVRLELQDVDFIQLEGGCILGMARVNPRADAATMDAIVATLRRHKIDMLLTIGGDDTAFGAREIGVAMGGQLRTVHVPKTIDNDLPLPPGVPTFGFTTARHVGVGLVQNLIRDARTCKRWYLVVSMGRQAGHLALGIGKAAGANLTIIPEEFGAQEVTMEAVSTILEGAVLKALTHGRGWGVAVLAEGLVERMDRQALAAQLPELRRDAFGHVRLSDVELGSWLAKDLTRRLESRGHSVRFGDIKLGYELRCAQPVPFDIEYTRDLGFAAVRMLAEGQSEVMVAIVQGKKQGLSFASLRDPKTGRTQTREVDTTSESYLVARRYMDRLTKRDLDDAGDIAKLALTARCTPQEFIDQFAPIVAHEPESFGWSDEVRDAIKR